MSTLLHIDSSPLYGRSVSRELTAAFVTQWKAAHPDGKVIDRDLNATAMAPINAEWVGAVYTPEQARTPEQKGLITGKKATFIIATGGMYDAQTRMASFNFVEPYLRSVFGFLGVTDATFLTAGGTSALNQGNDRNTFLAPHLQ